MDEKPPAPGAPTPPKAPLPLLYRRIEPLNAQRHADVKLRNPADFALARGVGAIPVTLGEFAIVARQYPIVFLPTRTDAPPLAAAALGADPNENLFVGPDGRWMPGFYVPAYLRRLPFITGDTADRARKAVYLDVESERVSREEGAALYENGALSKLGRTAIEFCRQYHGQVLGTAPFNGALAAANILVRRFYPEPGGMKPRRGAPTFLAIDEQKLAGVPDATFLEWRAKGWLPMVYLHLFSLAHFASFEKLKQRRAAEAATATPMGTA
ncbi:MAG: SapC family protein [Alphaproteobacteria bacterium]|nr:SapC family protein [Alphaproteobacteria bacterium]